MSLVADRFAEVPPDAVILVNTSTVGKIKTHASIFAKLPVRFLLYPLSLFSPHRYAIEDGLTGAQNADLKHGASLKSFYRLLKNGFTEYFRYLREIAPLPNNSQEYIKRRTYMMSDDTTVAVPKPIWDILEPKLRAADVNPKILNESEEPTAIDHPSYKETPFVSVPDIGPILATVGHQKFANLLAQSAAELFEKDSALRNKLQGRVPLIRQITCTLSNLVDETNKQSFTVEAPLFLYAPNGLHAELTSDMPDATFDNFLCTDERPELSIAEWYSEYMASEQSAHRHMAGHVMKYIGRDLAGEPKLPDFDVRQTAMTRRRHRTDKKHTNNLLAFQIGEGSCHNAIYNNRIQPLLFHGMRLRTRKMEPATIQELEHIVSMEFGVGTTPNPILGINVKNYDHADVIILPPFDPNDQKAVMMNTFMAYNAVIAKLLDPRYFNVPIIFINENCCYDKTLKSLAAYVDNGFTKETINFPIHEGRNAKNPIVTTTGVTHRASDLFDVLSSTDRKWMPALEQVLEERMKPYFRFNHTPRARVVTGTPKPEGLFAVAVIGSASSNKKHLIDAAQNYGVFLANNKIAAVSGGGDKPEGVMGPFFMGYRDAHGIHHSGFSTHHLIEAESSKGQINPDYNYGCVTETIGPRATGILSTANVIVHMDGGAGTGQECAMFLMMKQHFPELAGHIPLIIHNPGEATLQQMHCLIGESELNSLLADPLVALKDKGIYLTRTQDELEKLTLEFRDQFNFGQDAQPVFPLRTGLGSGPTSEIPLAG